MESNNENPRGLFVIFSTALITLVVLSMLPWSDATNNLFKDFNLLGDLVPASDKTYITHEELDPELANLHEESSFDSNAGHAETVIATESTLQSVVAELPDDFSAPTDVDGTVLFEDYSADGRTLVWLSDGLRGASASKFNIAFIGDSYIEGDILTQDIRALLQDTYGGSGVGYMAAYSDFPGFRQSVTQSGHGWTAKEIRKMKSDDYRTLQGTYYTAGSGAEAHFKGTKKPAHTNSWDKSTILFIAREPGSITLNAADGYSETHSVEASTDVQALVLDRTTTEFGFTTDIANLIVLGTWLESANGVRLDCMSLRGNSGISHRNLNAEVSGQMRQFIDYDLIILEFGINALSSEQTDYTTYTKAITQVVATIRANYPNSKVMLLGIGDRGQKQGTDVGSMATASAMVKAQREAARLSGALFWDTRAAMGGDGAVVDWHRRGLVNSDYIHLNHKGGKELARIFVESLNKSL